MASIKRAGRARSPGTGVVVKSRSSRSSTSFAVASRPLKKGLIFPFITFLPSSHCHATRRPDVSIRLYTRYKEPDGTEAHRDRGSSASVSKWHFPHCKGYL